MVQNRLEKGRERERERVGSPEEEEEEARKTSSVVVDGVKTETIEAVATLRKGGGL
jgi:hypothetical protein